MGIFSYFSERKRQTRNRTIHVENFINNLPRADYNFERNGVAIETTYYKHNGRFDRTEEEYISYKELNPQQMEILLSHKNGDSSLFRGLFSDFCYGGKSLDVYRNVVNGLDDEVKLNLLGGASAIEWLLAVKTEGDLKFLNEFLISLKPENKLQLAKQCNILNIIEEYRYPGEGVKSCIDDGLYRRIKSTLFAGLNKQQKEELKAYKPVSTIDGVQADEASEGIGIIVKDTRISSAVRDRKDIQI